MYKILIVDDEHLERVVLRKAIEEYLGDKCIITTASNGRIACTKAVEMKADIIFMDIEMPGLKGLDASKAILQVMPECRIIMLTAYSKFEYARDSLSFGAIEYLLKPCSNTELFKALDFALAQVDIQRKAIRSKQQSMDTINDLKIRLAEQIILNVMGGFVESQQIRKQLSELGITFYNGVFGVVKTREKFSSKDIFSLVEDFIWNKASLLYYDYDGKIYILCISQRREQSSADCLEEYLRLLCEQCNLMYGESFFWCIGYAFEHFKPARTCFYHAVADLSFLNEKTPFYISCKNEGGTNLIDKDYEEIVAQYILVGDISFTEITTSTLIEALVVQQLDFDSIVKLIEISCIKIMDIIYAQTDLREILKKTRFSKLLQRTNNVDTLKTVLTNILINVAKEIEVNQQDRPAKIRQEIIEYLNCNFHRDISLQSVAGEMNYSDTYFSKLFKQCFNTNFILYLTEIRIEKAKRMLAENRLSIKEIGERVGYADPNYFTKVFRKSTGQTPSRYRYVSKKN